MVLAQQLLQPVFRGLLGGLDVRQQRKRVQVDWGEVFLRQVLRGRGLSGQLLAL